MRAYRLAVWAAWLGLLVFAPGFSRAQSYPESTYQQLHWRMIGPFRGGRTRAAAGVPSKPNVFYIGAVNGGVWKSDDYGRTWNPIFDSQPTQLIGAIAVAPSDPDIVYVASGEGLHRPDLSVGNGIYKSTDAGKTWKHLGVTEGQQIPALAVDPRDPDRLFAAVLDAPMVRARSGVLFVPSTAGSAGKRSSTRTRTRVDPTWPSILPALRWCMPLCGKCAKVPGRTVTLLSEPVEACSNPPMAGTPGSP
jgi:hypothetical protein